MLFEVTVTALIAVFVCRVFFVIHFWKDNSFKPCVRTLIVIGSGGHTSEMTKHITNLSPKHYHPRMYVLADSDPTSKKKVLELESSYKELAETEFFIKRVPRSRTVGQSYFTSVFTTIYATVSCIPIVFSFKPDVILCNGPGTCIPICLIGFLLKVFFITKTKIVFIESICRVQSLSLTGKILLPFADRVLVQWPELQMKYPKSCFIGRLV